MHDPAHDGREQEADGRASRKARLQRMRARRAARSNVPGFPEFVARNTQCRLCQMVDTAPDVLRVVHQRFAEGVSEKTLAKETLVLLLTKGETALDHQIFRRHFKNHVDMQNDEDEYDLGVTTDNIIRLTEEGAPDVSGDNDMDDQSLSSFVAVVERLQEHIKVLEPDLRDDDTSAEAADIRQAQYKLWMNVVTEFVRATEALTRARNSNRVMKLVVQAHTARVLRRAASGLPSQLDAVMRQHIDLTPEARHAISTTLKNGLRQAGEEAVTESLQFYKLH